MIHSISAWLGLYYYPGRSADLTRWTATDDDQNEQQQPQLAGEIVLYSLSTVVIQVDHQEQQQQQTWEKMVLQINVIPRGTTGHRLLRGLLYPGNVIWLDPRSWIIDRGSAGHQVLSIEQGYPHVTMASLKPALSEADVGIATVSPDATVESFRKMVQRIARDTEEAFFLE